MLSLVTCQYSSVFRLLGFIIIEWRSRSRVTTPQQDHLIRQAANNTPLTIAAAIWEHYSYKCRWILRGDVFTRQGFITEFLPWSTSSLINIAPGGWRLLNSMLTRTLIIGYVLFTLMKKIFVPQTMDVFMCGDITTLGNVLDIKWDFKGYKELHQKLIWAQCCLGI